MQRNQTLLILSLVILLFSFLNSSIAQPPAYRPAVNRVIMNQQMQMQNQMQMQMMSRLLNMPGIQSTMQGYNFIITLRDSTTKEVNSAIYTDSATRKSFIVSVDKKYKKSDTNRYNKIYASQTLNLVCVLKPRNSEYEIPGIYLPGKPTDTCWMFKAISGHLSAYSSLIYDGSYPIDPSIIVGIQLNDGPILKFNDENLRKMVGQDVDALEAVNYKKYDKAIKKFNRDMEKATKK